MDMIKKVSVIVPAYNIEKYIERCVKSICRQTYTNLEILLIDDGSTDQTGVICDKLAKEDTRIRVFRKENGGSSSARNLGISKSVGDYLGFVDSDDYIEPFMYEILVKTLQELQTPIAQIGRREMAENGEELARITLPPKEDRVMKPQDFLTELLMHRGDCSFCTKLIKKELFEEFRFPLGVLNEDFYLLVQMLLKGSRVALSKESGYFVCYRIGSNTRKESKEEFSRVYADCVDNADMVETFAVKKYPDLADAALRFALFQRNEYLLHIPISMMKADNKQYMQIKHYIRKNLLKAWRNPFLTGKNKLYTSLFALEPKVVRKLHRIIKRI